MYTKIETIINNNDLRQELIVKGWEQAKKYNWWDCAYNTYRIYYHVIYGHEKA
jgi:hypothetical protein